MRFSEAIRLDSQCDSVDGGVRIGLALRSKKMQRYATPNVLRRAHEAGGQVIQIDTAKKLTDQGPFNVIIHKLVPSDPFYNELESYVRMYPHTRVIDDVKQVRSLQSRSNMLRVFCEKHVSSFRPDTTAQPSSEQATNRAARDRFYTEGSTISSLLNGQLGSEAPTQNVEPAECTFSAPKQVVCPRGTKLEDICTMLSQSGVQFPVISKPIASDGTDGSHSLTLFLCTQALQALVNPDTGATSEGVVLQQFEEHGGVLFKVYVLGALCEVKLRPSLQLPQEVRQLRSSRSGWIALPRFSTTPIAEHADGPMPAAQLPGRPAGGSLGLQRQSSGTAASSIDFSEDGLHVPPGTFLDSTVPQGTCDMVCLDADAANPCWAADAEHGGCLAEEGAPEKSTWPQLKQLGRELSQEKARCVKSPSGLPMISWNARTGRQALAGSGRDLGFSVQDPGNPRAANRDHRNAGESTGDSADVAAVQPPLWALQQLAAQLKQATGLTMFNMDVLCPRQQPQGDVINYRVVDINYFPGFDKLSRFEDKFADFLVACGREAAAQQAAAEAS